MVRTAAPAYRCACGSACRTAAGRAPAGATAMAVVTGKVDLKLISLLVTVAERGPLYRPGSCIIYLMEKIH